ncbi:MAG: hypothetical protein JOY78_12755, partial [Pseudonocardia sp.]|nr:hypothetical protein [Pseudonocardia sp.]
APLEARVEAAEAARAQAVAEANQLRAMVTALVSQIAPQSVKRAEAIERELLAAARPLVPGLPERVPESAPGPETRVLSLMQEDA